MEIKRVKGEIYMPDYILQDIYQKLLTISVKGEDIFTLGNCITSLRDYIIQAQQIMQNIGVEKEEEE